MYNTSGALFDVTKFVSHQYRRKDQVLTKFLDHAKAFYSANREKLIDVWRKKYCNSLDCFRRNFFLEFQKRLNDYGVDQGSCTPTLGPLLFLIYTYFSYITIFRN